MEDGTGELQLLPQGKGIDQISVVDQGQGPFTVVYHNGLGIIPVCGAGGPISHMTHRHMPLPQPGQHFWGKHLFYQAQVFMRRNDAVVAHSNAAALLPPMLQGKEAVIAGSGNLLIFLSIDAEDAAFLSQLSHRLGILLIEEVEPAGPHSFPVQQ